jgi:hypothetical protein
MYVFRLMRKHSHSAAHILRFRTRELVSATFFFSLSPTGVSHTQHNSKEIFKREEEKRLAGESREEKEL